MGLEHIGRVDRKQGLSKNGGRAVVSVVPHGEIYQALSVRNPAWTRQRNLQYNSIRGINHNSAVLSSQLKWCSSVSKREEDDLHELDQGTLFQSHQHTK